MACRFRSGSFEAASAAEAIEAVEEFLGVAGDGVTELRVMLDPVALRAQR